MNKRFKIIPPDNDAISEYDKKIGSWENNFF